MKVAKHPTLNIGGDSRSVNPARHTHSRAGGYRPDFREVM